MTVLSQDYLAKIYSYRFYPMSHFPYSSRSQMPKPSIELINEVKKNIVWRLKDSGFSPRDYEIIKLNDKIYQRKDYLSIYFHAIDDYYLKLPRSTYFSIDIFTLQDLIHMGYQNFQDYASQGIRDIAFLPDNITSPVKISPFAI